jgi:CheY-like chemotaxis protein
LKSKGKILLVDDDLDFLNMHKVILENRGYTVSTATSGNDGLASIRSEIPDLIILDLMMEKHDSGFSFSNKVKKDPLFKSIPILMVTSVAEVTGYSFTAEEDGYWMKTDDFLDKPVKPDVLIKHVERLIQKEKKK